MLGLGTTVFHGLGRLGGRRGHAAWSGGVNRFVGPSPLDLEGVEQGSMSNAREQLVQLIKDFRRRDPTPVPLLIGAEEVVTKEHLDFVSPLYPDKPIAYAHVAGPREIDAAVQSSLYAGHGWRLLGLENRLRLLLRAAEIADSAARFGLVAAFCLNYGQPLAASDTLGPVAIMQAFRAAAQSAHFLAASQQAGDLDFSAPLKAAAHVEHDALDGFVYLSTSAYSPASTAALLASALVMGNSVVWRPSSRALLSSHYLVSILRQAGLPPGVLNVLYGKPAPLSDRLAGHPSLAALACTGAVATARAHLRTLGLHADRYRAFPRLLAQGPANAFLLVHASASAGEVASALLTGAFKDAGQDPACVRRAYVPQEMWQELLGLLREGLQSVVVGAPQRKDAAIGTLLGRAEFAEAVALIERARKDRRLVAGGSHSEGAGLYVFPTVVLAPSLDDRHLQTRTPLSAPVLFVHVYDEAQLDPLVEHLATQGELAGSGAVFCADRSVIPYLSDRLSQAVGKLVINDVPSIVNAGDIQVSPLAGSRLSGSNLHSGSLGLLLSFSQQRLVLESFEPEIFISRDQFEASLPDELISARANNLVNGPDADDLGDDFDLDDDESLSTEDLLRRVPGLDVDQIMQQIDKVQQEEVAKTSPTKPQSSQQQQQQQQPPSKSSKIIRRKK